jgi:transposase
MSDTGIRLAARIGIDWADQHHDVSLQATGSNQVEAFRIRHTPADLTQWVGELRKRFPDGYVGIAVETSRGPLVHGLLEHDFIRLYPVNPRSLQRFRETFTPSGAKDDRPDADLLRELLVKHRDRLRPWEPDDEETRALGRLVQMRRGTVDQRTELIQQLGAALKEYFPLALTLAGADLSTEMATDFLLKWPTLSALQRARPKTVRQFYYDHSCRRREVVDRRLDQIRSAVPLTTDPAILETSTLLVQALARQLKALALSIAQFDQEIARRFDAHPDAYLFESLPGSGDALAPRLLTQFGSDRDRFEGAADVQKISGVAPVTERTGKQKKGWVHRRWSAPTFALQSFHEFAKSSIQHSAWARAYYTQQRERGNDYHTAVRALAFKWIRIIYRCWKDRTPYDEDRYVRSLIQRGSPLAARLGHTTAA